MAIVLLGLATPAVAQEIPGLAELPASVAASNPGLASRRAALEQERAALHGQVEALNGSCTNVEVGSAAEASCNTEKATLTSALNFHIQASNEFNTAAQAAMALDTSVVDARNVPSGLPKSVENQIPHTPAGDRVKKGFEAIADHDWQVAIAWFQDALNHDPGNAGIARLVDLAKFTYERHQRPAAGAGSARQVTAPEAMRLEHEGFSPELARDVIDYDFDEFHRRMNHEARATRMRETPPEPASPPAWRAFIDSIFTPPRPPHVPSSVSTSRG
jgi:hypothetical protein